LNLVLFYNGKQRIFDNIKEVCNDFGLIVRSFQYSVVTTAATAAATTITATRAKTKTGSKKKKKNM
jgi:ABC-type spermidine/putrescine transport system permease subunit I